MSTPLPIDSPNAQLYHIRTLRKKMEPLTDKFPPITDVDGVFGYCESFTNLEKMKLTNRQRSFRLDRMTTLLSLFGDPQKDFKSFHIAGTKGKGSTAIILAAILESAGHKTGLYTSPHVSSYLERINVSLKPPDEELLVSLANQIRDRIESLRGSLPGDFPATTFELLTLLAFLTFRETKCEYAVVETGIGGRLDATNVVSPQACLLTPLDLEHTELLGNTIEQIAAEKGGIIKSHVPVFCGFQDKRAKEVFRSISQERGASIRFLDEELEQLDSDINLEGTFFSLKLKGKERVSFTLSLRGIFQAENASLVYLALAAVMPSLPYSALQEGFRRASLPGRMEIVNAEPSVMLDGAHTPLAVQRLLESYQRLFPQKGILIFGSVTGKNPHHMAELLAPNFSSIIVSKPGSFKQSDPKEVFQIFQSHSPETLLIEDPGEALKKALELSQGTLPILVTGSFYMICEIRRFFPALVRERMQIAP
jgi:dihydrofolate synthase/folylpolyglutamate synthase